MKRRTAPLALIALAALAAGCAGGAPEASTSTSAPQQNVTQPRPSVACSTQPGSQPLAERASAFDSTRIAIGAAFAQVCYSRPVAKNRVVMGDLVPFGKLWRTGANEPTIIHIPVPTDFAGIRVGPGSYSLYTVPGEAAWTVILNRSTSQWGHESTYTPAIQTQEVGRAEVPSTRLDNHVEAFTIRSQPGDAGASNLVLEWERTRVTIPVRPAS